eukprot:Nk52_evm11s1360 gene=Nk52_evmTU11s1360
MAIAGFEKFKKKFVGAAKRSEAAKNEVMGKSKTQQVTSASMQAANNPPKLPKTSAEKQTSKRLIVILERCTLQNGKVGKDFQLLNCDDHKGFLAKHKKDIKDYRPDITHQCLLNLLDSPLNRAGLLQIYMHTEENVLIEINPHTRIPRTYKRFAALMVQLLHKLQIRAANGPEKLLKVIKNPITDHLPAGCRKILMSYQADTCMKVGEYINTKLPSDEPIVFVIGAMAHGKVEVNYCEEEMACSEYPLSAAIVCSKLCSAYEDLWGVL